MLIESHTVSFAVGCRGCKRRSRRRPTEAAARAAAVAVGWVERLEKNVGPTGRRRKGHLICHYCPACVRRQSCPESPAKSSESQSPRTG